MLSALVDEQREESFTKMGRVKGKRIVVTGGHGFLGRAVCSALSNFEPLEILAPHKSDYDLTEQTAVRGLYRDLRPDIVIHLAAVVGGIGANIKNPGRFFYENAVMGIMLMEEARRSQCDKFVNIGTICSYPKHTSIPFRESDLWHGYPDEATAPYGLAKKALLVQAKSYREQYGFNAINLLSVNLYGPGDNFDPGSSHVIAALIKKVIEAKDEHHPYVDVWGTGTASREFLYVDDAARGIVLATDRYDDPEPCNLGSGQEITIKALVELICELCDYRGDVRWDTTKPDGQPRRCLDVSRARERFGFVAETDFRAGLRQTIEWYRRSSNSA